MLSSWSCQKTFRTLAAAAQPVKSCGGGRPRLSVYAALVSARLFRLPRDRLMWKRLAGLLLLTVVTLLTQVGGLAVLITWLIARWAPLRRLRGWSRAGLNAALFVALYAALHGFVVPPLAALGGRVPLPCSAQPGRPFAAGHPLFCLLDRHYVDPRLVTLITSLSRDVEHSYPGTVTLYLDGNLPLLNGFPLLPHLSHDDGRKLDIAFYYAAADGAYRPGRLRSPIGYWAFEQPSATDETRCPGRPWLTLRWDMRLLQRVLPALPLEPHRTGTALRWLVTEGRNFDVERVFIESYLATRLGVTSPLLGFQGCRAARHDDHIHVQLKR